MVGSKVVSAFTEDLSMLEDLMRRACGSSVAGHIANEHLQTGGKRLRARLALASCEALGVSRNNAIPWAAACELAHNATLIHDDLQDGDTVRRGSSTTWVRHGMVQAINAGDLLLMLPFLVLENMSCDDGLRWHLSRLLASRVSDVIQGQADEAALRETMNFSPDAYEHAVRGKTSGLFELPVQGALMLSGDRNAVAHGFDALGVAFQLHDDVLDLYGDKQRDKPGSDIAEGKISGLVVAHLKRVPQDSERLKRILSASRDETLPDDIAWAMDAFRASGALRDVCESIHTRLAQGQHACRNNLLDVYLWLADVIDMSY